MGTESASGLGGENEKVTKKGEKGEIQAQVHIF